LKIKGFLWATVTQNDKMHPLTIVKRLQEEGAFLPECDEEDAAIRRVLTANQPPYRRQHGKG